MLTFVLNHLKTKDVGGNAANNLPFVIKYFLINIRLKKCVIKLF